MLGIGLVLIAVFAYQLGLDSGNSWGTRRYGSLIVGLFIIITSVLLCLPKFRQNVNNERINAIAKYVISSISSCLIVVVIIELLLRIFFVSPPLHSQNTNWFGSLPKTNSVVLWGKEGYALTHYEALGEIKTPFSDGRNVILLGDSFMEAWQVSDEFKSASVAEKFLRESGYKINIRNFGKSGLTVADYVSWIPLYKKLFDPIIIVLNLSEDDFIKSLDSNNSNYFTLGVNDTLNLVNKNNFQEDLEVAPGKPELIPFPVIRSIGHQRIKDLKNKANTTRSQQEFNQTRASQQIEQLLYSCDGTELIIWLNPSFPAISGDEVLIEDENHEKLKYLLSQYSKIKVIDPLPDFIKLLSQGHFPKGFFNTNPDNGHLNRFGNKIVGELIANAIREIID